jgi:hypothetical protein
VHAAWCVTLALTDPNSSVWNPPLPRDPTTSRSASRDALTSSSAGSPWTTLTVTSGGGVSVISLATLSASSCTAFRVGSGSKVLA